MKTLIRLFFFLPVICWAQLNPHLAGNAINVANDCFFVTPDQPTQSGGVWFSETLDFNEDFSIYFSANFGDKDLNGGDGVALVFKTDANPVLGNPGSSIAYEGINNSLAIEFDAFQNSNANDPSFDHISFHKNGSSDHSSTNNLAGPVQANPTNTNIEDDLPHNVKVEWIAATKTMSVRFDCIQRLTLTDDVVNSIFNGTNHIYYGFVGSTSNVSNTQQICINGAINQNRGNLDEEYICTNGQIVVDATIPTGDTYLWSPTNGVSDPTIANPTFTPINDTLYNVTIVDECGEITNKSLIIRVKPILDPLFDSISPICEGETVNPLPNISNNGIAGTWSPSFNNITTTTYTFTPDTGECAITTDVTIVVDPPLIPVFSSFDPICLGEAFALPLTSDNGIVGTWSPALDNTTTTTYTFTPDISHCATTTTATINVEEPITPNFVGLGTYCIDETIPSLPTTSIEGITGTWSPSLNNTETTTYTFTPDVVNCANSTTMIVSIDPISTIYLTATTDRSQSRSTVTGLVPWKFGDAEFQLNNSDWQSSPEFDTTDLCGTQTLRARLISGCSNVATTTFVAANHASYFTPNQDGYNDQWSIECLQNNNTAKLYIFDRHGSLLKTTSLNGEGWDGTYQGNPMPASDYWFKAVYNDNGIDRTMTGHFTLKR